jgi:putative FmdB family regulatory protein
MPRYVFECQQEGCSLRFERTLKMSDQGSHECPSCHEQAPRVMEGFSFGFNENAAKVGNSGVHKEDYPTADHAVGRDAEKRWGYYAGRDVAKNKARTVGETHALTRLTGTDYVEYAPMTGPARDARKSLTKVALTRLQEARAARDNR